MYKYYLGAFGNRSYIRPQYEIMGDGLLREVGEARWEEFANGGTVSLSYNSDEDLKDIKNRLLKFRIDFNKDLHPNFDIYNSNSNKYQISLYNIEDLDRDVVIEVIDTECTIDEFLNDKTKRTVRIKHKPNKLIMLRNGQDCYGPFEFMISDIEESYGDEAYYTIKIIINSGVIKTYKQYDLQRIILDGNYTIRRSDSMAFIYNLDKLYEISPYDQIEYFDNEELADYFKSLLDKSTDIEDVAQIRERFLQIANTFSEGEQLSDQRIKRICELLQTSAELKEYKVRLMEEYFRSNPNAKNDKEEYLRTHEELLDEIVRNDTQYEIKVNSINGEIKSLRDIKANLESEIQAGNDRLREQEKELEKLGEQAIAQKKHELEETLAGKKQELRETEASIERAKRERDQMLSDRDTWKRACESVQEDYKKASNNLDSMIVEWAANNRNTEIVKLLVSQLEMPEENEIEENVYKSIDNLNSELNAEQIVSILCKKMNEAGRNVSKDDAYNYLISIVQNYITVFAGEPGTGKTSLCKLLAKALGLYNTRFAEIPVERGWTSSKDLIGYYNPLTKEIEETQPVFSKCMKVLTMENNNNNVQAPYFVLLDEANLSPIEYYWSHFNYYCDDPTHQRVKYSDGTEYSFGAELKFLATINYDQTTADLSPRFLDRAWVITMGTVQLENIISNLSEDSIVENNKEIISLDLLNNFFDWRNVKEKKMNQITRTRLDSIIDKMKEGGHTISARSLHAISHYYLVAEGYMSSKEVALDYAVSQKILPCISGTGKRYGEFLNGLMNICKENQLNKSATILSKIIERSEHEFYGFFSL